MRCPYCRADDDKVIDSRLAEDGTAVRRRRECLACGRRYSTLERALDVSLVVRKRSGELEPFDHDKLVAGIARAASGRLDDDTVDTVGSEITESLRERGAEISSEELGMAVLERLRALDPVAYLRFASVYKGFEGLDDFERAVDELQRDLANRDVGPSLEKTTEPKQPRR
ncbi:MAG TPA: transcriptional regulator NrdR [Acidimicrobiia bacterium]|jgi:transcriptional repressor NrdR|nr:transcriptional regulator NrdR [Acidimicrobiia bacterium]